MKALANQKPKINQLCWFIQNDQVQAGIVSSLNPLTINGVIDPKIVFPKSQDNYDQIENILDLTFINEMEIVAYFNSQIKLKNSIIRYGQNLLILNQPAQQSNQHILFQYANNSINHFNSIILLGECGSGKSEIQKQLLQYFSRNDELNELLISSLQLLESFGYASIHNNKNSSRFLKNIELYFSLDQKLKGIQIQASIFEKSRVTSQIAGERNFFIFYQFLQSEYLQKFQINPNQPINIMPAHQDYGKKSNKLIEAFKLFNFNIDVVFSILAAIIKLGNINFEENQGQCQINDHQSLQMISQFLGIEEKEFLRCLCYKTRSLIKNEIIDTPLSRIECINQQQNIMKYLYERLFYFIIEEINKYIQPNKNLKQDLIKLNIIDPPGFETTTINGFDQLINNYQFEKFHFGYIQQQFVEEFLIFQKEGLQTFINQTQFITNQQILDTLEKSPLGILNILDDSCAVAGTDETFLNKIKTTHNKSQYITFTKQSIFKLKHTIKEIEYNVIGFRIKNKDELNKQLQVLLSKSKNIEIIKIYSSTYIGKYVGTQTRTELNSLSLKNVSYIYCLKFQDSIVMANQLRSLGITDILKFQQEGYPIKIEYNQFLQKYLHQKNNQNLKFTIQNFIKNNFNFEEDQILYGNTLIFLKYQAYKVIQEQLGVEQHRQDFAASKIQNAWICYKNAMVFKEFQCRIRYIQAHIKGYLAKQRYKQLIQSVVFIQYRVREFLKRINYLKYRKSIQIIQTYFKRLFSIKYVIVEEQAIIKIQHFYKNRIKKRQTNKTQYIQSILGRITDRAWKVILYRAATCIQKYWIGYYTRKIYDEQVSQIKLAGFLCIANKAATTIQKYVKRNLTFNWYQQQKQATLYIQRWIRSIWCRQLFLKIKYATIIIQRGMKKYFNQYRRQRKLENIVIKPLENELNRIKEQEFMNMQDNFIETLLESEQENLPTRKIDLFTQIIDLEILTDVSEIYDTLWSCLYKQCFKECYDRSNFISTISIGECHAYVGTQLNKVYTWGMNDYLQQGITLKNQPNQIAQIQFPFKIKSIKSGANHGLLLSSENILYQTDEKTPIMKDVKLFSIYNDDNICVDENNYIYLWKRKTKKPIEVKSWTTFIRMSQLQQKVSVHQISHGLQFIIVLSNNGLMFAMGENTVGELGINQSHSQNEFTLIELSDKIAEIHCGMKHTIAKSTLGKVYTWGWGQMGQLGFGNNKDEHFPKQLQFEGKVLQVMAGHKQSLVILENRKTYWWGTNSCLSYQLKPIEYISNYPIVRVVCSWSRTISIVYITFAKTYKQIDTNIKLKHKILNQLVSKWSENDIFSFDPPYCESLANYYNQMKKPQQKTNIKFASKIEHQQLVKQLQQSPFTFVEDIKDNSCFFSFKNESNNQMQKKLQEHSDNQNPLKIEKITPSKLTILQKCKKYKNEPQLQDILKYSELNEILHLIN